MDDIMSAVNFLELRYKPISSPPKVNCRRQDDLYAHGWPQCVLRRSQNREANCVAISKTPCLPVMALRTTHCLPCITDKRSKQLQCHRGACLYKTHWFARATSYWRIFISSDKRGPIRAEWILALTDYIKLIRLFILERRKIEVSLNIRRSNQKWVCNFSYFILLTPSNKLLVVLTMSYKHGRSHERFDVVEGKVITISHKRR